MTIGVLDGGVQYGTGFAASYRDNVIPDLAEWSGRGERCALVTLVGVDGNAPRAVGAQMAVSERGHWSGYISGGCLEQAIVIEAADAINSGKPRLVRYGKGSPFFDIRLPCGSGLDVFIQPLEDKRLIQEMGRLQDRREPFALRIDLAEGKAEVVRLLGSDWTLPSRQDGDPFLRVYTPSIRCLVIGSSPIAVALAELAACAGFTTDFYAPEPEAVQGLLKAVTLHPLLPRTEFEADRWTAAVLAFHDHDQEIPIFAKLLDTDCFFIGAIGSRNAHSARVLSLTEAGHSSSEIARIKSPAGLVGGLKTAPFVALSILTEIVATGRDLGLVT